MRFLKRAVKNDQDCAFFLHSPGDNLDAPRGCHAGAGGDPRGHSTRLSAGTYNFLTAPHMRVTPAITPSYAVSPSTGLGTPYLMSPQRTFSDRTGLLAAEAGNSAGNCENAFARLQQRMSQHDVSGYVVQVRTLLQIYYIF